MPLIAHNNLPTFARLRDEGESILDPDRAQQQDIRELHIGLLNMMPDAALAATERQFFRLVGESNQIAQFFMHPFSLSELPRSDKANDYIQQYYESFDEIKAKGLDALIITGANVTQPNLEAEPFWDPLIEVIDWAYQNVTSTLCSCLTTHAVLQFRYKQKRQALRQKQWGVFEHRVLDKTHPLVKGVNTRFDVPHSRFNQVSTQQFNDAGLKVLVESEQAGVHLAVSEDLFRLVFFQGHPEYDTISLLKEYKREVLRYTDSERNNYPPFPDNYFNSKLQAILDEFQSLAEQAKAENRSQPEFPEALIADELDITWRDTAEAVIDNWIGTVYQLTNNNRKLPFMKGINIDDPLKLRK